MLRILDEIHPALKEIIRDHLLPLKGALLQQSSSEIGTLLANVATEIQPKVDALIKKRLGANDAIQVQISGAQLQGALAQLEGYVDIGKTLGTAALAAVLASQGVPPHVLYPASEEEADPFDAREIAEGVMVASVVNMSKGSRFGEIIKQVNPVEWVGNFIHHHFKGNEIDQEINRLIAEVTTSIHYQLREYASSQVFEPAEMALKAAKQQLDGLIAEEKQDGLTLTRRREEVANDILTLGT